MKNLLIFVLIAMLCSSVAVLAQSDADLRLVTEKDKASRDAAGKLMTLPVGEHVSRGFTYMDNRHFPEAREHFQKMLDVYPTDPLIQRALFGMGRALMWERQYAKAIPYFDLVAREFPASKDGREGLYFQASCEVRVGNNAEAARHWQQYTVMYPQGERIDGSYVNSIDALREAGKDAEAVAWVEKVRERFRGQPTETNALQARLRMEINRGKWADAEATAALMQAQAKFAGSLTSLDEVKYLRALALDKQKKKTEAIAMYTSIADTGASYYGGLATERLVSLTSGVKRTAATARRSDDYPAAYREDVLRESKKRKLDPRFIMSIMKVESSFRPGVKSPSAARGLLQLVYDTAVKYNKKAGYPNLQPDDLYTPSINIALGCEYIADLKTQFGGLNEAIAASYNGGEDNSARWLSHTNPKDPGIFASEVGFAETKNYVFKVMTYYRVYRDLYDENLVRR
ncbi:MAG: transglycosylase SLT domain-containing protein [Pyrinomonadaceae bacterium]